MLDSRTNTADITSLYAGGAIDKSVGKVLLVFRTGEVLTIGELLKFEPIGFVRFRGYADGVTP